MNPDFLFLSHVRGDAAQPEFLINSFLYCGTEEYILVEGKELVGVNLPATPSSPLSFIIQHPERGRNSRHILSRSLQTARFRDVTGDVRGRAE